MSEYSRLYGHYGTGRSTAPDEDRTFCDGSCRFFDSCVMDEFGVCKRDEDRRDRDAAMAEDRSDARREDRELGL